MSTTKSSNRRCDLQRMSDYVDRMVTDLTDMVGAAKPDYPYPGVVVPANAGPLDKALSHTLDVQTLLRQAMRWQDIIDAALAMCRGTAPSPSGVSLIADLDDDGLRKVGTALRAAGIGYYQRPDYNAEPGSPKDWAIRCVRRAFDLTIPH
jgi:hypothetical protein